MSQSEITRTEKRTDNRTEIALKFKTEDGQTLKVAVDQMWWGKHNERPDLATISCPSTVLSSHDAILLARALLSAADEANALNRWIS